MWARDLAITSPAGTICPEDQHSKEHRDRLVGRTRRIPLDVPKRSTGVDDRKTSLVLVMLDPAPDVLPLKYFFSLAPL